MIDPLSSNVVDPLSNILSRIPDHPTSTTSFMTSSDPATSSFSITFSLSTATSDTPTTSSDTISSITTPSLTSSDTSTSFSTKPASTTSSTGPSSSTSTRLQPTTSDIVFTTTDSHGKVASSTSSVIVAATISGTSSNGGGAKGGSKGFGVLVQSSLDRPVVQSIIYVTFIPFFHNTGAVAGVFAAVSIVVLVLIIAFTTNAVRRHRKKADVSGGDLSTGCSGITREKLAASDAGIGASDIDSAGNMGSNSQTQHLCDLCKYAFTHEQDVLEWSSYGRHPQEYDHHTDVQLPIPGPRESLVPHRHDPTPSSRLWRAPSGYIVGSEEVNVLIGTHEGSTDNLIQRSSAVSTILNPDHKISAAPTSRADDDPSYDDGFSIQSLSTIPPSYCTRRADHEVEPWTPPPAYTTSHNETAQPPSTSIYGQRVLRLHGPRGLLSVSSVFSDGSIRDGREMSHVESMPPVVRCG
ncbi:hypothetical protein OH76DRAFT_1489897 [Lentinus brumalis]|uniref:Uncharacterized protein n=1 Tax=Lentinus brumalis TaxID=2498619 RepID=A0A371CKW7_9APHY|nr:hypothetical protein OH76DRAFT_1489897 [Polyporus brumalis]